MTGNLTAYRRRHRSAVRFWNDRDSPVGVGFVVGERQIMTCAHVVQQALAGKDAALDSKGRPTARVRLDSMAAERIPPVGPPTFYLHAQVRPDCWVPRGIDGDGDIAVLDLCPGNEFPPGTAPVRAVPEPVDEQRFSAFGIAAVKNEHIRRVIEGTFKGYQDDRRYQIGSAGGDDTIRPGCSGAAAWTESGDGIAGMIVEWQEQASGVIIPAKVLNDVYPLAGLDRSAPPAKTETKLEDWLWERLHTFDRVPQTNDFNDALQKTWYGSSKPLLCVVGGVAADMPRLCRDRLREELGGSRAEIGRSEFLIGKPLPWPSVRSFNVSDELSRLKNGLKVALGEKRRNDAATLRALFNERLEGVYFYSYIRQELFNRNHAQLLKEWKEYWAEIGADAVSQPLVHILLITFDEEQSEHEQERFYRSRFVSDESKMFERLSVLGRFGCNEVLEWLDELPHEPHLGKSLLVKLKRRAVATFRDAPEERLAALENWIQRIDEGDRQ
jgi:hypothetical protein